MTGRTPKVAKTRTAMLDLIEIGNYLAQAAGLATSDRFLSAAETTFEQLARSPGIGALYEADAPTFEGLRYAMVTAFRGYVVFYRSTSDGIEIIRVLHGARDMGMALGDVEEEA